MVLKQPEMFQDIAQHWENHPDIGCKTKGGESPLFYSS
jgi:hypothetical protein